MHDWPVSAFQVSSGTCRVHTNRAIYTCAIVYDVMNGVLCCML